MTDTSKPDDKVHGYAPELWEHDSPKWDDTPERRYSDGVLARLDKKLQDDLELMERIRQKRKAQSS